MKKQASTNYGIQAQTVRAEAIAVGPRAHASATTIRHEDLALDTLHRAIQQLLLEGPRQQAILNDVTSLKTSTEPASTFDKIISAVKEVGHVAELVEPLKAVARAFGLPIPF